MIITGAQLRQLCPSLTEQLANELAQIANELIVKYSMTVDIWHEFISNIAHESGEFKIKKESLYYSTPQRLVKVWPTRFTLTGEPGKLDANKYTRNPTLLANTVYANRMGNTHEGDGSKFVGGGFAQITGRDAYEQYSKYLGKDLEEVYLQVQSDNYFAFDSAFWFFCIFKNLESLAMSNDFKGLVKRWNGGYVGIEERQKYYNKAKIIFT